MTAPSPRKGLLLVGHGTREPRGVEDFLALAGQVAAAAPQLPVVPCFLELARPSIAEGVDRLAAMGVRAMVAVPLMLFAAAHVRRDIPAATFKAAARHPGVTVRHAGHLGCRRAIVELSARRYEESLRGGPAEVSGSPPVLVLAGRGSRDARATREMVRFAELRRRRAPVAELLVGFLDMARPRLDEALDRAARLDARRVVVQPHLLFPGSLVAKTNEAVARARRLWPDLEWTAAGPLGPDPLVAEAVLEAAGLAGLAGDAEQWDMAGRPAAAPEGNGKTPCETPDALRQLS